MGCIEEVVSTLVEAANLDLIPKTPKAQREGRR
jgi:hypothetical protein